MKQLCDHYTTYAKNYSDKQCFRFKPLMVIVRLNLNLNFRINFNSCFDKIFVSFYDTLQDTWYKIKLILKQINK